MSLKIRLLTSAATVLFMERERLPKCVRRSHRHAALLVATDGFPQPGFGEGPKTFTLAQRHAHRLDRFGHAHSDKITQLDEPGRVDVHFRQLIQHFMNSKQFGLRHAQLDA